MAGSIDLGATQYGDVLQRAQFWNLPGVSPNYHVLGARRPLHRPPP